MGKPKDPEYWVHWRAAHPAYRARERVRARGRDHHADRSAEAARRKSRAIDTTPLAPLYPELQHGSAMAYWEDELRMDLAQERALAELEGRDPDAAETRYANREKLWHSHALPLIDYLDYYL